MKKLLLFALFSAFAAAQTNTFPITITGTAAAKPGSCNGPSFYFATDTGTLSICNAANGATGIFIPVGSSSGGTGVPSVSINPGSLNFGTVQSGSTTPPSLPASISNTSSIPVTVNSITVPGSDFSLPSPSTCLGVLDAFSTCVFQIQSNPATAGAKVATATVTTTAPIDPQNPLTLPLAATGTGTATFPLSLIGFGLGSGSVTDGGSLNATFNNGICSGTCSFSYTTGSVVTITATPNSGSTFNTFGGAGLTTSPATLTVTQAQTVTVQFDLAPPDVTLRLASTGQGGGTIISDASADNGLGILNCVAVSGVVSSGGSAGCNGPFPQATIVTLTETPNANSTFVGWSGAPGCTTATTCVVTLNSNVTITANFSANSSTVQLSLVQTSTNCSVSGSNIDCVWAAAQQAGDANICAGTWPDATTTVVSLSDTGLNTYTQVPTISPKTTTGLTQVVYYAQNIIAAAAGTRHTTMVLSSAVGGVTGTGLTAGHAGGASTTYTTASVTLTNNNLILLSTYAALNSGNGPGAVASVVDTGCGLTWVNIPSMTVNWGSTQGTGTVERSEVWRALGNGSSCTVTVTWTASPATRGAAVSKFSGVDTSGSSGSGAIGITATNKGSGTAGTVTMGTFGSSSNGTFQTCGTGSGTTHSAGTGMTMLNAGDGEVGDAFATGNITSAAQNFSATVSWGCGGLEVKATSAGRRDMRCLEYAGVKQSGSPIDVSAAAVGSSSAPSSGGVTTGTANDLITGFTASATSVNAPSTGYTQRVKNSFGDDGEDQEGVPVATYAFAPSLTSSGNWIASQIAWLSQSTSVPTVFSLSLNGGGNGNGTVTGNAGTPTINGAISNGNCTGSCSSQVSASSSITLTASPQSGSVFANWTGATGCSTSPVCIVPNITNNQNITATFTLAGQLAFFVNHATGNDNNSGLCAVATSSCNGPFRTIQAAVNSVAIGATGTVITVAHNTYPETVTFGRGGASQTRRMILKCDAQWDGGNGCKGASFLITTGNNIDIGAINHFGFEYSNASANTGIDGVTPCATDSGACASGGNSIHVIGNYLHDIGNSLTCPSSGAIIMPNKHGVSVTDIQIIGNVVDHIGPTPGSCNQMQGIYISSQGGQVYNNMVFRSTYSGIQYYDEGCNARISNNVIANNGLGVVLYGNRGCTAGLNSFTNNIVVNNQGYAFNNSFGGDAGCSSGHQTLYSNNIVFGNNPNGPTSTFSSCTTVQTQISENPTATFVGYTGDATGNYQLQSTSRAVNGGTSNCTPGGATPCIVNYDIVNVSRPQRVTFDIGAYELP